MILAKYAIDECINAALEMVGVRGFEPPTT